MSTRSDDDERFMRHALAAGERGVAAGQSPFGAAIVRRGQLLAAAHNQVWLDTDITAHAEVVAIRQACRAASAVHLEGATIYSTTEPCPMCFSAIHWARIGRIVYGASIADAARFGFNELAISNQRMKRMSGSHIELTAPCLGEECVELFRRWQARADHRAY